MTTTNVNGLWTLPSSWAWAQFGEVAEIRSDLVAPSSCADSPHIAPNHIESETGRLLPYLTVAEDNVISAKHRFFPGQILYSKIRPYLAKAVRVDFHGLCSADMYPISAKIDPGYLHRWMLTGDFTRATSDHQGRTVLPKINQQALVTIPVPLAPRMEQVRISKKLEALLTSSSRTKESLDEVPALLDRLRRSTLAAALRGDLSADWRTRNPDVEPADELLHRIHNSRERPTTRRASRLEAATPGAIEAVEPLLPSSWKFARMGDVARLQPGFAFKSEWYRSSGVRLLRGTNITPGATRWDDVVSVDELRAAEYAQYSLLQGDIVIAMDRPIISSGLKVCRIGQDDLPCLLLQRVGRLIPEPGVIADFIYLFLQSDFFLKHIDKQATGTQLPHVSGNDIESAGLPIPPTAEQALIVARVGALLEKQRSAAMAHAGMASAINAFERTILARAFRGELVPQDPNDEPASVQLERLRAEAAAAPAKPGRRVRAPAASGSPAEPTASMPDILVRG